VRSADARTGEHRDGHLRDHRQVDADHVARLEAAFLQHVGEPLHVAQQLAVGHVALLALLAAPVEGHPVAPAGLHVAVERLVRGVQLPAHEPLVERRLRLVEHGVPGLRPVEQLLRLLRPPRLGVPRGLLIDRLVLDQSLLAELRGRLEDRLVEKLRQLLLDLLSGGLGGPFHHAPSGSLPPQVVPEGAMGAASSSSWPRPCAPPLAVR
jgi:hypothetical protein